MLFLEQKLLVVEGAVLELDLIATTCSLPDKEVRILEAQVTLGLQQVGWF